MEKRDPRVTMVLMDSQESEAPPAQLDLLAQWDLSDHKVREV